MVFLYKDGEKEEEGGSLTSTLAVLNKVYAKFINDENKMVHY